MTLLLHIVDELSNLEVVQVRFTSVLGVDAHNVKISVLARSRKARQYNAGFTNPTAHLHCLGSLRPAGTRVGAVCD